MVSWWIWSEVLFLCGNSFTLGALTFRRALGSGHSLACFKSRGLYLAIQESVEFEEAAAGAETHVGMYLGTRRNISVL